MSWVPGNVATCTDESPDGISISHTGVHEHCGISMYPCEPQESLCELHATRNARARARGAPGDHRTRDVLLGRV